MLIVIGIEMLTDLAFGKNRPYYTNFASLGAIFAHELGHSIDASNKVVNKYGIPDNEWSEISNKNYSSVEACLVDQFGNYTLKGTGQKVYYLFDIL